MEVEEEKTLIHKLNIIQSELQAPKDLENDYGGYKYRSCESILENLKPLLAKYSCLLIFKDSIQMIGDRFYLKTELRFFDDSEFTEITTEAFAREAVHKKGMDEAQLTGATSSYCRKYALNAMFLIDDAQDNDDLNKHEVVDEKTYQAFMDYIKRVRGFLGTPEVIEVLNSFGEFIEGNERNYLQNAGGENIGKIYSELTLRANTKKFLDDADELCVGKDENFLFRAITGYNKGKYHSLHDIPIASRKNFLDKLKEAE